MADWNKPNNSDPNHVDVLQDLADKDTFALTMRQAGGSFTNIPEGAMAYDNVAKLFKRLTSAVETIQQISITGGGTGASTAAGARTAFNVLEAGTGASQIRTNAQADAINAPLTRTISTTSPLQGGGTLEANRTLTIDNATTAQKGAVQLNNTLTSSSTTLALTAAQGKVMKDSVDDFLSALPPVTVWTGSDSFVTSGEILASSGHVVQAGEYYATMSTSIHNVSVIDITKNAIGTSSFGIGSAPDNDLSASLFKMNNIGTFFIETYTNGSAGTVIETITEIQFKPL